MNTLFQNLRTLGKLTAVVVILVVVNLAVAEFDWQWDMTEANLYTLSSKTEETVRDLEDPLTMYFFHAEQRGASRINPDLIRRLVSQYQRLNPSISFEEIDPNRNPSMAREYNIRQNNTLVLEVEGRTKTLGQFDLYEFPRRRMAAQGASPKFRGERAITEALVNLTSATDRVVYFTEGHGEYQRSRAQSRTVSRWANSLEEEGYTVETLNPLIKDLPDTRDLMVVLDPVQDLNDALLKELRGWYRNGGNLILAASPESATALNPVLDGTGLEYQANQIIDPARRVRSIQALVNPFIFAPRLTSHPSVQSIKEQGLVIQVGRSSSIRVNGDTGQALMRTSSDAYAKPLGQDQEEVSMEYNEETDQQGPFVVAAAVSTPDTRGRLAAFGNASLFGNSLLGQAPGNSNFGVNLVNWIFDRQVSLGIEAVPLDYNRVTVTQQQAMVIQVIALVAIPLFILIWGGWVWWKRKNR